uniref:Uncharacterized protein n=1 Tax=Octopus bimaculoides TaxID=37653 RepID=A0A0L8HRJ4_OCTBM
MKLYYLLEVIHFQCNLTFFTASCLFFNATLAGMDFHPNTFSPNSGRE